MRSSRFGILGVIGIAAGMVACPFVTTGTGQSFTGSGGHGGDGSSGSTSTSTHTSTSTGPPPSVCEGGAMESCYDSLPGTSDAGAPCMAGVETCDSDGLGWGACLGAVMPTTDNCASGLNLHCETPARVCTGTPGSGSVTAGEMMDDQALAVAVDPSSNAIVVGSFHNTVNFGNGQTVSVPNMPGPPPQTPDMGTDGFVAKIDPTGKTLWAQRFGDMGNDVITGVAVDGQGDVFIVGTYNKTVALGTMMAPMGPGMFFAELDPTGAFKWGKAYPGDNIQPRGIAVGADGHLAIAGLFSGNFPLPAPSTKGMIASQNKNDFDGFVLGLDATGTFVWIKQIKDDGQPTPQVLYGVAIGPNGVVVVTGDGIGNVDFGDGSPVSVPTMAQGLAVAQYQEADGTIVWKQLLGNGSDFPVGNAVTFDANNDLYVTGSFQQALTWGSGTTTTNLTGPSNQSSLFVGRLTLNGDAGWAVSLGPPSGGSGNSDGYAIATDAYSVVVGGTFDGQLQAGTGAPLTSAAGTGGGNEDALVVKLELADGSFLWAQQLGGMGPNMAAGVAMDPSMSDPLGKSVVAGYFSTAITFGTTADGGTAPIMSMGGEDIFLARLAP